MGPFPDVIGDGVGARGGGVGRLGKGERDLFLTKGEVVRVEGKGGRITSRWRGSGKEV